MVIALYRNSLRIELSIKEYLSGYRLISYFRNRISGTDPASPPSGILMIQLPGPDSPVPRRFPIIHFVLDSSFLIGISSIIDARASVWNHQKDFMEKEIRPILVSDEAFKNFDERFRVLCALKDQTIGERFEELMLSDLKRNARLLELKGDRWVTQQELVEALDGKQLTVSRQTLRNNRKSGALPKTHFVESKIESDSPNAAKNQRTFYKLQKCIEHYRKERAGE